MKKALMFIIALCFSSAYGITLEEAQELALKNYPKLKSLEYRVKSLKEKAKSISLSRFGELDVLLTFYKYDDTYTLTPLSNLPSPLNPPPFDSEKLSYGIGYSVPLYQGGTIRRKERILKLQAEILEDLASSTKWQIKYKVSVLYLNYLSLSSQEKALLSYKESLLKLKESVKIGIERGKLAKVDILKVEYSISDINAKLTEIRAKKKAILESLKILVGRDIKKLEPVKIKYEPLKLDTEYLYKLAMLSNHTIKAKDKEVKVSLNEVKNEKSKYGLKVKLDAVYTRNYGFESRENEGYG
ncbi:MAG: TolC family protein, partial [Desulfurobacteriaceae bacterium]